MKFTKEAVAKARAELVRLCPPGTTIYTKLNHVSRSGMSRSITPYVIVDNAPQYIAYSVAVLFGQNRDRYDGITMRGCGIDMGFALVYNLSSTLYRGGFGCIGERCPSNDHANGDRDYRPHDDGTPRDASEVGTDIPQKRAYRHYHRDGGYALRREWL